MKDGTIKPFDRILDTFDFFDCTSMLYALFGTCVHAHTPEAALAPAYADRIAFQPLLSDNETNGMRSFIKLGEPDKADAVLDRKGASSNSDVTVTAIQKAYLCDVMQMRLDRWDGIDVRADFTKRLMLHSAPPIGEGMILSFSKV